MGIALAAMAVALTTFVVFVLATVLADLVYVRNRVPLPVLAAPALVASAAGAPLLASCWLVLAAAVTAQRDKEADGFGLLTSLLLLVTVSFAWALPGEALLRPGPLFALAFVAAIAVVALRRFEMEPVPRVEQAGLLALVLLVTATDAVR